MGMPGRPLRDYPLAPPIIPYGPRVHPFLYGGEAADEPIFVEIRGFGTRDSTFVKLEDVAEAFGREETMRFFQDEGGLTNDESDEYKIFRVVGDDITSGEEQETTAIYLTMIGFMRLMAGSRSPVARQSFDKFAEMLFSVQFGTPSDKANFVGQLFSGRG